MRPYFPEPDVVQDSINELNMQGLGNENDDQYAAALKENIADAKRALEESDMHIRSKENPMR